MKWLPLNGVSIQLNDSQLKFAESLIMRNYENAF